MAAEGAPDFTCREVVELVTDYLEGALPAGERLDFERHLVWCEFCRVYLDQVRAAIELTGSAAELEEPSAPLRDELVAAFRDWKQARE